MIKCLECGHENPFEYRVGKKYYCDECGEEITAAAPTPTPQPVAQPSVAPTQPTPTPTVPQPPPPPVGQLSGKKVATLIFNKIEFDINEGQTLIIARSNDNETCVPDIPVEDLKDAPTVSSRPIRVTAEPIPTDSQQPRTLTVSGDVAFRVMRWYHPGQEVTVYPGDVLWVPDKAVKIE